MILYYRILPTLFLGILLLVTGMKAQDIVAMLKRVKPSVVAVVSRNQMGLEDGQGSGFFIERTRVVTNFHVIEGASAVFIRMNDSAEYPVKYIVSQDSLLDLAVLEVDLPGTRKIVPLTFRKGQPEQGERVYVVGNPLGLEQSVSDGIVSSVRVVKEWGKLIQFTASISPGNSGSPLLDGSGAVLGVVRMNLTEGQNLNFAVPIEHMKNLKNGAPISFLPDTKAYQGQVMKVADAFVVDTALIGIPPNGITTHDVNIWRLKVAAARASWKSQLVEGNLNRIIRAVRRLYQDFDIDRDTLTMTNALSVVKEALGDNTGAFNYSPEQTTKLEELELGIKIAAMRVAYSGDITPLRTITQLIGSRFQIWQEFRKDNDYMLLTVPDSASIKDIDVAIMHLDNGVWNPVAANTENDGHCIVSFTAPDTGEYAIIWRVAQFVESQSEGIIGAMLITR